MFIAKDSDNGGRALTEAEELKPSCEVHGGNLFVQLHFKAVKAVPDSAELVNTVVTSRDESSAEFSGCGKHLVAVSSTDEETPLTRDNAVKYIKAYLGTMFGQDVGNSLKDDDIHTIDEKGEEMDAAALKKWEEQQKEKGGEDEDKESVDESIPSFGRFMLGEDAEDDGDPEEQGEGNGAEEGGEDDEAPEEDEGNGAEEDSEDDEAPEEDEAEDADEEVPPPATYLVCYMIKADGQPEKDHTDPKTVESLSPKGKLKLPGGNFNLGIEFKSGGATVDTIDLKKAAKGFMGKVDSDEITRQMNNIMRTNFPTINTPNIAVRDNKTIGVQLDKKTKKHGDAPPEIDPAGYNGKLKAALANSEYSMWVEVTDYREKPFIHEKDIADVINAAVKKVGGRWAKMISGVKPADVFFLHGMGKMSKEETDKDNAIRTIPNPSEIEDIIDKNKGNNSKIVAIIDKQFDKLARANYKASDNTADAALKKWNVFKNNNKDKFDTLDHKVFIDFYDNYLKFYNKTVSPMLSEEFISERDLMQEIFGILYEDDAGDERAEGDIEGNAESDSGSSGADFDDTDDSEEGEEDNEDGSSGSSGGDSESSKEDQVTNIFIVPMKGLDVETGNSGSSW